MSRISESCLTRLASRDSRGSSLLDGSSARKGSAPRVHDLIAEVDFMRGVRLLTRSAWLAAFGMLACAPAADFGTEIEGSPSGVEPGDFGEAHGYSGVIDVTRSAPVSLSLRGGLGPIVEGQTVSRAVVAIEAIELVGADGAIVPFLNQPVT